MQLTRCSDLWSVFSSHGGYPENRAGPQCGGSLHQFSSPKVYTEQCQIQRMAKASAHSPPNLLQVSCGHNSPNLRGWVSLLEKRLEMSSGAHGSASRGRQRSAQVRLLVAALSRWACSDLPGGARCCCGSRQAARESRLCESRPCSSGGRFRFPLGECYGVGCGSVLAAVRSASAWSKSARALVRMVDTSASWSGLIC